jgi:hypothetical protein
MFLYILGFNNKNMIKIGRADSMNRIVSLSLVYKDYDVILEKSYIVTSSNKRDIKVLETQLLQDYIDFKIHDEKLKGRDGYTELRDDSILTSVLQDIDDKAKKFPNKNLELTKLLEKKKLPTPSIRKTKEELRNLLIKENKLKIKEYKADALTFIKFVKNNINFVVSFHINVEWVIELRFNNAKHIKNLLNDRIPAVCFCYDYELTNTIGGYHIATATVFNYIQDYFIIRFNSGYSLYANDDKDKNEITSYMLWFYKNLFDVFNMSFILYEYFDSITNPYSNTKNYITCFLSI